MRRGMPTGLRAAVVAVTVALLALVVALAGSGGAVAGEPRSEGASTLLIDLLLVVVVVLCLVLWVVLMPMVLIERRKRSEGSPRASFQRRIAAGMIAIVFVTCVIVLVVRAREERGQQDIAGSLAEPPVAQEAGAGPEPEHASGSQMAAAAILTLVVCAGGAYLLLRSRRRPVVDRSTREQIAQELDEAVDDLRAEPDPRRAVVAAYARMERTMALHGAARESWEAPHEYLARALAELGVGPSAGALTALFEQARFSEHAIGEPEREAAIEALLAVRDDLRAVDAGAVAA